MTGRPGAGAGPETTCHPRGRGPWGDMSGWEGIPPTRAWLPGKPSMSTPKAGGGVVGQRPRAQGRTCLCFTDDPEAP